MKRNQFLKTGMLGITGLCVAPTLNAKSIVEDPGPIKIETVKEFVAAGHSKIEQVKEMLAEMPNLLFCKYDWGNGDYESAIEGAGHMGNKEIANYLIEQGARVNLFVLTMLGKTALVKPMLEAYPQLIQAKGPHGFSLLHHAKKGGDEAKELYEYLLEKGLKKTKFDMV